MNKLNKQTSICQDLKVVVDLLNSSKNKVKSSFKYVDSSDKLGHLQYALDYLEKRANLGTICKI